MGTGSRSNIKNIQSAGRGEQKREGRGIGSKAKNRKNAGRTKKAREGKRN